MGCVAILKIRPGACREKLRASLGCNPEPICEYLLAGTVKITCLGKMLRETELLCRCRGHLLFQMLRRLLQPLLTPFPAYPSTAD